MEVDIRRVDWPFVTPFRIAYEVRTHAETVLVELKEGNLVGRGEALGVSYHGETADKLFAQLQSIRHHCDQTLSREKLQALLPPGGARNALDCALWDLEAMRLGRRSWDLAGIQSIAPLRTAFTLGIDTPERMSEAARAAEQYSLLKLKLSGEADLERVKAIRATRPDVDIIVDANQAWDEQQLRTLTGPFAALGVKLIEQPLPAGKDHLLTDFDSPVPLCADESCQTSHSVPSLVGKYQYVNIKLDKTGGLTEALRLAHAAQAANLKLMVGCMGGSSLSMAPAFVVGQLCDIIDLDGPLLAASDVPHGIRYEGSRMSAPERSLWG